MAEISTATDADTIMARMPVAYAPACASTSAWKAIVMITLIVVYTSTTGRIARLHSGAIP